MVGRGFEPQSIKIKDYLSGICYFFHQARSIRGVRKEAAQLRFMIMFLSKATCLLVDCCLSKLAL